MHSAHSMDVAKSILHVDTALVTTNNSIVEKILVRLKSLSCGLKQGRDI